jgi:DNA helicase-2/ATP-dependent DNA helicase PcrA
MIDLSSLNLSSLNENQLEAVLWDKGPLLVLAGSGSGKTRVLTCRIARILEQSAGQHFRILALTLTNKAAAEMRGRAEELVPSEHSRVRLTTFHSYLRRRASPAAWQPSQLPPGFPDSLE